MRESDYINVHSPAPKGWRVEGIYSDVKDIPKEVDCPGDTCATITVGKYCPDCGREACFQPGYSPTDESVLGRIVVQVDLEY